MNQSIVLDKHEIVVDKYDYEQLVQAHKQLVQAIDIIAGRDGDYTQNVVYDALIETGYYKDENEEMDEE